LILVFFIVSIFTTGIVTDIYPPSPLLALAHLDHTPTMSLASRDVEYSRKQRIIGGLVGVRAYYRERWTLRAVQYVGCKAQLIKRRDASVGQEGPKGFSVIYLSP